MECCRVCCLARGEWKGNLFADFGVELVIVDVADVVVLEVEVEVEGTFVVLSTLVARIAVVDATVIIDLDVTSGVKFCVEMISEFKASRK